MEPEILLPRPAEDIRDCESIFRVLEAHLPPEVAAFCREQDLRVLATGHALDSEESFDGENGFRLISVKKVRARFPDGKDYVVGTIRDLTEVRTTERQLKDIVEMIEETIWSMDADTLRTLYMSPSAERMYGRPLAQLCQPEIWQEILHVEDAPQVLSACAQVRNGESAIVEFRAHHPTLGVRMIHMKAHPVRDDEGRVRRIEGIATDVTERLRAEKELTEHQQKLVAISKMNTLGELASGIGQKVADIIQGLKDLSRDRTNEERIDFDPLTSLNQALSLTRARFSNQAILLKLENHLPPGQRAHGVPTYLFQSIVNLLNNAFDALVSQGEKIDLEKMVGIRLEKVKNEIRLSVSDSGPGVAPGILPKLFEPFQTTKSNADGTGLGLSISRRLMRQIGGDLVHDADSDQTTFVIFLPVAEG